MSQKAESEHVGGGDIHRTSIRLLYTELIQNEPNPFLNQISSNVAPPAKLCNEPV